MAFSMRDFGVPNFRMLGGDTLILDLAGPHSLANQECIWRLQALSAGWDAIVERVAGMNNLTLRFDPSAVSADALRTRLLAACSTPAANVEVPVREHEIEVQFGAAYGPDLPDVSESAGLTQRETIDLYCARVYRVYFLGFQPGFAYLGDLDEALHVPRRARPRTVVPAGSVAIGGMQTGIYPFASPGGWNIIGRACALLFDPAREPAALFAAGDRVRFVEVS